MHMGRWVRHGVARGHTPAEGHLRHLDVGDAAQAHAVLVEQRVAVFAAVAAELDRPWVL